MQIFHADRLIDGSGAPPQPDMEIVVEAGVIQAVAPAGGTPHPEDVEVVRYPGMTVLPGMIDVHVHLMFGDPRTYEVVIHDDREDLILLRAARNAYQHLRAGVTLVRDCGAANRLTFDLRQAARARYFLSPRLHVCGRPLTMTGGHFYWCNEEADGVDEMRAATRKLLREGADFIKIMSGGGGGTRYSDSTRPSFTVAEMAAAIDEAHAVGKKTTAHCLSAEATVRAVEAGIDQIEHFNFLHPDGSRVFDEALAEKIVAQGVYLSPTISTGYRRIESLQQKAARERLSAAEQKQLDENLYKLETKLSFVRRFFEMGAPIVAGTDATPVFGDYAINLELLHRAGLPAMQVICAATSGAARSMGCQDQLGMIRPGLLADFVFVDGDPLDDIQALGHVEAVVLDGQVVVDKRREAQAGLFRAES
jgi:imidazolonepropionase-like amidohydrolase